MVRRPGVRAGRACSTPSPLAGEGERRPAIDPQRRADEILNHRGPWWEPQPTRARRGRRVKTTRGRFGPKLGSFVQYWLPVVRGRPVFRDHGGDIIIDIGRRVRWRPGVTGARGNRAS